MRPVNEIQPDAMQDLGHGPLGHVGKGHVDMREFLRQIVHKLEDGVPVELVSLVASSGSTPRGAGAMLAVFPEGSSIGTIGGGNVEYSAQLLAKELLTQERDALREFRFVQGDAASLGMVCGGDVTVQFQYLSPNEPATVLVLRDLMEASGENLNTWLVRRLEGSQITAMGTGDRNGFRHLSHGPASWDTLLQNHAVFQSPWFAVPVVQAGRVYIFGGGHVSQALTSIIASVGFRPVVYDDRAEFADPARFPLAENVLCGSFNALSDVIHVTPDDYVVIMTRGHQADYEVLTQTLRSGAKYLGCIGSRKKLALCRDRLLLAGFTAEEYAQVHAPIGLAIGAETPEEIAISITAELIAVRAGHQ